MQSSTVYLKKPCVYMKYEYMSTQRVSDNYVSLRERLHKTSPYIAVYITPETKRNDSLINHFSNIAH